MPELLDITRVRVLVECEALTESIRNGDSEWRANVLRSYHRLDRLSLEGSANAMAWMEAHGDFHASLVAGCASPMLCDLCRRLFDSALRYRRISMTQRTYGRDKSQQHRELMEAALTADPEAARRLIHDHVWETTRNVIAVITGAPHQPHLPASAPVPRTAATTVVAKPVRTSRLRTKTRKPGRSASDAY
ncbi:MAG: FCD domain-containing protein [Pseudomonadota bacterium]|nr:FCD domain-containing protein [Pseudomonadota bacterium]